MQRNRILELASIIQENTERIDAHLTAKNLPTPAFTPDNPQSLLFGHGEKIDVARQAVVDATDELQALMLGPTGLLSSLFHNSLLSIQAILRFDLVEFPGGKEEVSFEELAEACGLGVSEVRRLLRHAMAYRIFAEPRKGYVAHTAASKKLADPLMRAWLGFMTEELWPSATKTVDVLEKWPEAEEPNKTSFNLAHGTDQIFFDEIAGSPSRDKRYADAMGWFASGPGFEPTHLVETIEWGQYEKVVDIGGSTGLASQAISRRHPSVKLVVQDRPDTIEEGRTRLPPELREKITFMEHDFFQDQPVCADAYLLRWVLHDWSDKYAIKILRALIPALKKGARIIVNEFVLPPPGIASAFQSKILRTMDLSMLELHNGKERDVDDWERLFRDCDPRFKYLGVTRSPGSRLAIIQAEWSP